MAIPVVESVGTLAKLSAASTTPALTVTVASGIVAGELLLILSATSSATAVASASGWAHYDVIDGFNVLWKIAGSSETSVTVDFTGAAIGDTVAGLMVRVSGADPTAPLLNWVEGGSGSTTNYTTPTVTTTVADSLVFAGWFLLNDRTPTMSGAGWTERINEWTTLGSDATFLVASQGFASTGAKTMPTWDYTGQGNTGGPSLGFAVRPAHPVKIVGVGTASGGTGATTPGLPSGWAPGDTQYLFHQSKRLESVTAPAGWTEFVRSTPTADNKLVVFTRVAELGDTAPTVADTGDHGYAVILGLRGANLVAETPAADQQNTASTAASFPSVSTGGADRLIIHAAADGTDATGARISGAANSNLFGVVEQFDNGITSNDGGGLVIITGGANVTGAIGNTTATYSVATVQARITFAVYSDTGTDGIEGALAGTLAALTGAATGTVPLKATASATLGAVVGAGTGKVALTGALARPLADLAAAGAGVNRASGALNATLDGSVLSSTSTLAIQAALEASLDDVTAVVTTEMGLAPIAAEVTATLRDAALVGIGWVDRAPISLPPARLVTFAAEDRTMAFAAEDRSMEFGAENRLTTFTPEPRDA